MMDKYIDDNVELGLDYDYSKINKVYKGLGIPAPYNRPLTSFGFGKSWVHVLLSKRNEGKTTNVILYSLCMRKIYPKFTLCYVRQTEDMTAPKTSGSLFDVIREFKYIPKLFKDYNDVVYKSRAWYLCMRDEDGKVVDMDTSPFMRLFSCDKSDMYKSSVNVPFGDIIIFDEFIPMRGYTHPDEFIWFNDIVKTILRKRVSAHVFLVANNVDLEHRYFDELGIYSEVQALKEGEKLTCYSPIFGTPIYLEWINNDTVERVEENKRQIFQYFGFKNKKLNSIRGGGWSVREYPRVKLQDGDNLIIKNRYIQVNSGRYLKIDIYKRGKLLFAIVHDTMPPAQEDSIVYSLTSGVGIGHKLALGRSRTDAIIWGLLKKGRVFYSTNGVGSAFEQYYKDACKLV